MIKESSTKELENLRIQNQELLLRLTKAEEALHAIETAHTGIKDINACNSADNKLKIPEKLQSYLFDLLNGFAYCKMIYNNGQACDFEYLIINQAFEKLTGLKDVVGKKVSEVIPGILERDPELIEICGRVASTGISESFEIDLKSLGLWFSVSVYSPEKKYFVAVFDVISERKKAENALKESQDNISSIYNATDESVMLISADETVITLNETTAKRLGSSASELTGQKVFNLLPPEVTALRRPMIKRVLETGEPVVFEDHRNGHWMLNRIFPILDSSGKVNRMAIFGRDITGGKLAQQALNESEARFRRLFESASLGIFQSTPEGKVISVNPAFATMFGYDSPEEMRNSIKNISSELFADPNRRNEILGLLEIAPSLKSFENEYLRKDGSTFIGQLNISRIHDAAGRLEHLEGFIEDITLRKRSEEALLKSKNQYDKLVANIPIGVYVLHSKADGSFALDYASPRMAEMLNLSIENLLNDARLVYSTIYQEDLAGFVKLNEEGIRLKRPFDWIGRIYVEGKIKWMHIISSPELLGNGDIFWHGLIIDITKEKLAEDAINEAHNRLLKIASMVPGVVYQFKLLPDGTSCFPYSSEGIKEIYRVSPEEVCSDASKVFSTLHPDDYECVTASILASAKELSPWEYEYRVKFDDGTVRWLWGNALPQQETDGSILWHGFITDITERKQAEFRLKEMLAESQRFRQALDNVQIFVYMKDTESRYIYANRSTLELFGCSVKELYGSNDFRFFPPETAKHLREIDLHVFRGENTSDEIEVPGISGERKIYSEIKSPIYTDQESNTIWGLLGISTDITGLKQFEQEIKHKNEELLKLNATKDKFFSIIAHDLKSPFNSILGFSQILEEQTRDKDYKGIVEYSKMIHDSAERAVNLLVNLLEWARSQTGRMEYNPEYFAMDELIHEITLLLDDSARQKSISINSILPQTIRVFADKAMMSTIMRNLISNAIKFTMPGGSITISIEQKLKEIVFTVKDTGVGISKSTMEKMFRIEESFSTPGTQKEKGTGLGLILCKDFIGKHGGKIWVESEVGKGSEFKFSMPI